MSESPQSDSLPPPDPGLGAKALPPVWQEFAAAPLVPVAIAVTLGLMLDRYAGVSVAVGLAITALGGFGWWLASRRNAAVLPWLGLVFVGLGAVHHHLYLHHRDPTDIGERLGGEPQLVKVRGLVLEEPATRSTAAEGGMRYGTIAQDVSVLQLTGVLERDDRWRPASGRVSLRVERESEAVPADPLDGIHAGDLVEVVGTYFPPRPPANPGERDYAAVLRDQRIRGEVRVADTTMAVTLLEAAADVPLALLARIRGWATKVISDSLLPPEAAVARALLLGDTAAMEREEWDGYIRTGVVHALAISGQHLVVLAGFAWVTLRFAGVRRVRGAWLVMLLIVGYTVLTGMRPSGVRAAVMVSALCGGLILRRPVLPANAFALGWLMVILFRPTDPFTLGCQLSFLSVFVLIWLVGRSFRPGPRSPFDELLEESRSQLVLMLREIARLILLMYAVSLVLAVANAPLLAADQHLVSPIGIVIGPPVIVLTSAALLSGFLMLITVPLEPLHQVLARLTELTLAATGRLVHWAETIPGGWFYTAGPPVGWMLGFYVLGAVLILVGPQGRPRMLWALLGWIVIGLLLPTVSMTERETRLTFLAVGKGGCTVIETADGRCLLYDAGTTNGAAAVRRVIAPYLWHRGIRRIDEILLSHADADHFNGLPAILDRFAVGQVTMTPSFAEKPTAEVASALLALEQHAIPCRLAVAGDRFRAGDVELEVLHPPPVGPSGTENERSLVIALRHREVTILLTGDLEKSGTQYLLERSAIPADVLMAPHHGSRAALPPALLRWTRPRLVVVSRGRPYGNTVTPADVGPTATIWNTWDDGAVCLRLTPHGLIAETYRDRETLVVRKP